ncbi:MAG: SHOCT domain-containing protein [Phycisphaeraceae bacterium]|nr:SHOCT domain-containing protein [Phycisphaeraceae bacterium]
MLALLMTTLLGILPGHWPHAMTGNWQFVLAASRKNYSSPPMFDLVLYIALITSGILVLIFIALKTKHWILDNDDSDDAGEFFSISQLRQLRDQGDLSETEYESAKRVLVAHGLSILSNSSASKQ